MRLLSSSSTLSTVKGQQSNNRGNLVPLYLNVYDLTPINNYLYWVGLGIYHSGIEVHGAEYGFGAHEYPTSGVFEVEPRSCPGFIFRRSVPLGSTNMSHSEFRSFMEELSAKYHGDTYHLIANNCNHFTDDVSLQLTGKPIPGWVNRLARLGSFCNCILPENIQATAVRHLPDHPACSDDEDNSESVASSGTPGSEEQPNHYLLKIPNTDIVFSKEKPINIVCDKVKEMKQLSEGYNIVALSQGNLIGRGVVEFCGGGPPVKNFISLAGPHAGTASAVPFCGSGPFCEIADVLIKSVIYSGCMQKHFAPSGYLKLPNAIPQYLKKCKFLQNRNNELPGKRNSTCKERFASLQNLILIMFENDTILIPKETSWFEYYPDGAFTPIIPPQRTKLYTEDWIGFKTLDDAGRVKFISVLGKHLGISKEDMKKHVVPYLTDSTMNAHFEDKRGNDRRQFEPQMEIEKISSTVAPELSSPY